MEKGETDKKVESAYFFYKAPSKNSDLIGLAPRIEETYFFALLDCIYWWKHALRSIDSFLSRPKDILQNNVKFISVRVRFFEGLATFGQIGNFPVIAKQQILNKA